MTLDDNGATFADSGGHPVRVTGVAEGKGDYDAVNYRQFRKAYENAYSGIASVAALASIPAPVPGKKYSVGLGFGNFEGESAVALGGQANMGRHLSLTAGLGYTGDELTTSVGLGFSF